jgi:CubicO group peptidase (beta-lactamase class C family)
VQAASKLPLTYVPGTMSSYGITSYGVLQHLIERVSGQAFPAFVHSRLFQPLGMQDMRFDKATEEGPVRTAELVHHRAGVYEWNTNRQKAFGFLYRSYSYSAGGLYSSAADLTKWITALDTGRILTSKSQEQLWTAAKFQDGKQSSFGLGWVIGKYRGRRTVGHSGGPALADILRFVDDRFTIIVLANQQKMYPYLAQGVADLYVPAPTVTGAPIADHSPETTSTLKEMLLGFGRGHVDVEQFAPEARAPLVGAVEQFAMPFLRALGSVRSLTLLEESGQPQRRIRRYRAWYGQKPILWRFELNQEGKILSMEPTPE